MKRRRDFFRKTQNKRYESHSFRNPYFQDKTKRKHLFLFLGILLFIGLLSASLLTFFLHPFFRMRQITVSGIETLPTQDVERVIRAHLSEPLFVFFTRQNRFLFRKTLLDEAIRRSFTLSDLQVTQQGTQLTIVLSERTSHLLWKTGDQQYVVDLEGIVIRPATEEDPATLPLFVDRQAVQAEVGKSVLTKEEIAAVFRFHEQLLAQGTTFTQTEFDRLEGKWTGILTTEGYRILFDTAGDIDAQMERLIVLKRDTIKDLTKLQYIDLRFGDHVYFK